MPSETRQRPALRLVGGLADGWTFQPPCGAAYFIVAVPNPAPEPTIDTLGAPVEPDDHDYEMETYRAERINTQRGPVWLGICQGVTTDAAIRMLLDGYRQAPVSQKHQKL